MIRSSVESECIPLLLRATRIIQMFVGLVFLLAGSMKVWDPVLFFWHAYPYTEILGLEGRTAVLGTQAALFLGPLEVGVGLALLANWRPNVSHSFASLFLLFFFGLTFFAWGKDLGSSCGCFGTLLERNPGEAAIENLVLFGCLIFAWWGTGLLRRPAWLGGRYLTLGGILLALGLGSFNFYPEASRIESSDLQAGVYLGDVKMQGTDLDLRSKGAFLVEIFSPSCPRCMEAVNELNRIQALPGMPAVVALTSYEWDSDLVRMFVEETNPKYTIASVSRKDFVRLAWRHGFPRLGLVRDGVVQQVWEHNEWPSIEELEELTKDSNPESIVNSREKPTSAKRR